MGIAANRCVALVVLFLSVLAASGCESSSDHRSRADCEKLAAELREYVDRVAETSLRIDGPVDLVTLEDSSIGSARCRDVRYVITPEGVVHEGYRFPTIRWSSHLETILASEDIERNGPICVAIDKAAPWHLVADFTRTAQGAGVFQLYLVFDKPGEEDLRRPPPSDHRLEIERIKRMDDGEERDQARKSLAESIFGSKCEPARWALATISGTESSCAGDVLGEALEREIVECECAVDDIDALEGLVWLEVYRRQHADVRIELANHDDKNEKRRVKRVMETADSTWSSVCPDGIVKSIGADGNNLFDFLSYTLDIRSSKVIGNLDKETTEAEKVKIVGRVEISPQTVDGGIGSLGVKDVAGVIANRKNAVTHAKTVEFCGTRYPIDVKKIFCTDSEVSDLTPLEGFVNLNFLDLSYTEIGDLESLARLENLEVLSIKGIHVTDLTPLAGLTGLKRLILTRTEVSDLTPLAALINLTELELQFTQVSDITPLKDLQQLSFLELTGAPVTDITPLERLSELAHLYLGNTRISDVSSLGRLTNLEALDLMATEVNDLTPLAALGKLKFLSVTATPVSDVTPLKSLANLEELSVNDTQVSDITPLKNLKRLRLLSLGADQVSEDQLSELQTALPELKILRY